ncbi:5,10-methylenetetrahydrofolate reductase [Deinobacterium chartae]|uniref:Methylenetetrahydrofolate reductase n=1 Tax=Deinobacterium chartae TaxID=521158 RepID=A0A841I132_9DEIO|nr:methylenetetrahydrofolate reductase [Deinobacterium chartae]MBB6097978.1 5,10-methylenetetrahydrofolate reductase [Deinobacterium chartae]
MILRNKLGRQFVVTVELDPPRGPDPSATLEEARSLRGLVDAVNVSDSPMANLRMNSVTAAHLIRRETGLEAIAHLTCRDRNVLALQSELLGAQALGVGSVLCLYGDPPSRGDHPEARGVFEVDTDGLIRLVAGLNAGRSCAGRDLGSATAFNIGVALNPCAADLERERERLHAKVAAGGTFAQTQPVFSAADVERFLEATGPLPIPVLFGVLPVRSVKMAQNVGRWAKVPEALLKDLEARGLEAGLAWAARLVSDLRALGVDGVHLYPLGKSAAVGRVLEAARV